MADFNQINQFGSAKPTRSGEGASCVECEAMLPDVMDGTLSSKQKVAFDLHIATCAECSQMLADAKRGAVLLEMLKSPRPEPSALLLDRIIALTSGLQASGIAVATKSATEASASVVAATSDIAPSLDIQAVMSAPVGTNVLPFRPRTASRFNLRSITQTMMQPRLAMTAAMAFFSITLTLNLTGVHLSELKASDLTPSNLKHSFYHANASVVRYYDNLRVVYELESRVNELKRTSDSDNPPAAKPATKDDGDTNQQQDKPRKSPKSGSGTSERRNPLGQEFKLAGYGRNQFLPQDMIENGIGSTARLTRSNKLKETSQEGDMV